ncbi:ribose-phosphate diphosphokinase [Halorhabdus salina]|uniref:ribose-phosphate diphosphokinase n=1 Tax=Halorhabdus salina TaxID=2750670 RepID=UPI0015EE567E|nr:ribose-phosphate diphosphokinase [Halorhabdus salina]
MILSGSASQTLAARIAAATGEPLGAAEVKHFPDGELNVQVTESIDGRAIVVISTVSNDAHIEALLLQDAARQAGAEEVITVVPYPGYARQNRKYRPGDIVSLSTVARALSPGTDRVITVNPHEKNATSMFEVPATAVDASGRLAEPLPSGLVDPLFLATDEQAYPLAESVRDGHGTGVADHLDPAAGTGTPETIAPTETSVDGRDVVLIDDFVATGATMATAATAADDRGAERIYATCVHPLLASGAWSKLLRAGVDEMYATDTLERIVSDVSVAPVIADAL